MSERAKRVVDTALTLTLAVLVSIVLLTVLVSQSGCSGVILSAEYSKLLDETTALSAATATAANDGVLDPAGMKAALRMQAGVWQKFRDGRDGNKPTTKPAGR